MTLKCLVGWRLFVLDNDMQVTSDAVAAQIGSSAVMGQVKYVRFGCRLRNCQ